MNDDAESCKSSTTVGLKTTYVRTLYITCLITVMTLTIISNLEDRPTSTSTLLIYAKTHAPKTKKPSFLCPDSHSPTWHVLLIR